MGAAQDCTLTAIDAKVYEFATHRPGTIASVLKRKGIEPAPERGGRTTWPVFLKAHWRGIVAADFSSAEVWS